MAARPGNLLSLGAVTCALVLLWPCTRAAAAPGASPAPTIVLHHYAIIPTPTPTPTRHTSSDDEEDAMPIPRGYLIGGAVAAALALAAISLGAARVWRSSNLFDRQYRFPRPSKVAVRLGGEKCGGHLASVQFPVARPARTRSKTKDV